MAGRRRAMIRNALAAVADLHGATQIPIPESRCHGHILHGRMWRKVCFIEDKPRNAFS
jgi:hypothetical protein